MMKWRGEQRPNKQRPHTAIWGTLAAASLAAAVALAPAPASAQEIERVLAGIRLNSKASTVLAKYSNPNQVVIGDVGIRGFGPNGPGGAGNQGGAPDGAGADPRGGSGGELPGLSPSGGGASRGPRGTSGFGSSGPRSGPPGGFSSGPPGGYGGPTGGFGGGPPGGFGGEGDGSGFPSAGGGATGGGIGGFGQTVSTLAQQQEVTWIYNRKVKNNLVSYNFLIGPNGNVVQILVSGYSDAATKTKRGIGLGSTYKDVVKAYGYPEEHARYGRVLVASYRSRAHVSFQFLNETPQSNPFASGNKVIGITIATVE